MSRIPLLSTASFRLAALYLALFTAASLIAMFMMAESAPVRIVPPDPGFPPTA